MRSTPWCLVGVVLLTELVAPAGVVGQGETVDFTSDRWTVFAGKPGEFLGRPAFQGFAVLKDVQIENGVLEVDIAAVDREQTYPGFAFRIHGADTYERFYVRPHRSKLYDDVLQYSPVVNGVTGWQLYAGDGYTALADFPSGEWVHVRLEFKGSQARVFIGDSEEPGLEIYELYHPSAPGGIGVQGTTDGTAWFSNFRYREDDTLVFDPPPRKESMPGVIRDWEVSQGFAAMSVDLEDCRALLPSVTWQPVSTEDARGLVDVARYVRPLPTEPSVVLARTVLRADAPKTMEIGFGYSDGVTLFLDGRLLYSGASGYRVRDGSFLGIVGYFDSVYLPLHEGENELTLMLTESFGGWGFMARDNKARFLAEGVRPLWETGLDFLVPESVIYDPDRAVLYVTNYDPAHLSREEGKQYVSALDLDGTPQNLQWVGGFRNPLGMFLHKNTLWVVDRRSLTEVDTRSGTVRERIEIPNAGFPNDVARDGRGRLYVSDSRRNLIYRIEKGKVEEWLSGPEVADPNGLLVDGSRLLYCNNGDASLKVVDLETKAVTRLVELPGGILDGLKPDGRGNYLVSHWQGRVYRVTPDGRATKLLDTTVESSYVADFEYVADRREVIVPTFYGNRVRAFSMP
jgi:sugar lactone lactonase YvrE